MNRLLIVVISVCTIAIVTAIYSTGLREQPTFVSPMFKECRTTAFGHHEQCLNWYNAREKECADALKGEMKICREVYPPILSSTVMAP